MAFHKVTEKGDVFASTAKFVNGFSEVLHGACGGAECSSNFVVAVHEYC